MELYQRRLPAEAEESSGRPAADRLTLPPFPVLLRVRSFVEMEPAASSPPQKTAVLTTRRRTRPAGGRPVRGKLAAALFLLILGCLGAYCWHQRPLLFTALPEDGTTDPEDVMTLPAIEPIPPELSPATPETQAVTTTPESEPARPAQLEPPDANDGEFESEPARPAQLDPNIVPLDPEESP